MQISIAETSGRGIAGARFVGAWVRRLLRSEIYADAMMTEERLATFSFVSPGGPIGIRMLRHGWSGKAKIVSKRGDTVLDLYSSAPDYDFVYSLDTEANEVVAVEVLGEAHEESKGCQVWLISLVGSDALLGESSGRTLVLTETVKVVRGYWGSFLCLTTDTAIPTAIERDGIWAARDVEIFRRELRPGSLALDIGANFGHHSVVFSKLVGTGGKVIAIEAQRVMHGLLSANLLLNDCWNAVPVHCAASDANTFVEMYPISYSSITNFGSLGIDLNPSLQANADRGERVLAITIDSLREDFFPDRRVDFVKMDIQAHEFFALKGMTEILANDRPTLFFEIAPKWMKRAGYDYREVYAYLASFGYSFSHFELARQTNTNGIPDVSFDDEVEWDVLAISRQ